MDEFLQVSDLCKYYPMPKKSFFAEKPLLKAVDHVSFSLDRGETLGIVGESGSGKSTLGQCILLLQKPTSGSIRFCGEDIRTLKGAELRRLRRSVQIVFQDPFSSLNPRMRVRDLIAEPLDAQKGSDCVTKEEREARVREVMQQVGLLPEHLDRYPHEFSGGQRQRIGIARALIMRPELIICDEAVSALDVSVQAQVINLLQDIKEQTGVSLLFISHDLSVVRHISDRILVLYLGEVMELCSKNDLYANPMHPYTRALLGAVPVPDPDVKMDFEALSGDIPSPVDKPAGCCFCLRCPLASEQCRQEKPALREISPGHLCACHFPGTTTMSID